MSAIPYGGTITGIFPSVSADVGVPPIAQPPLGVMAGTSIRFPIVCLQADRATPQDLTGCALVFGIAGGTRSLARQVVLDNVPGGLGHADLGPSDTQGWTPGDYSAVLYDAQADGSLVPLTPPLRFPVLPGTYSAGGPVSVLPSQQPLGQAPISGTPAPGTQSIWIASNALWINGGGIFGGEIILSQNGVPLVTLFAPNGLSMQAIRFQRAQGAQISSGSATIAPGTDGDLFQATGHGTNILQMITTGFQAGADVDLEFVDTTPVTIKHMGAGVGSTTAPFFLGGSADLVTTGRSCLLRVRLVAVGGAFVYWREVSRSLG